MWDRDSVEYFVSTSYTKTKIHFHCSTRGAYRGNVILHTKYSTFMFYILYAES